MIEKLYGDNPELKDKALKVHSQFFNTQPAMGDMILGIDVAIEEQNPTAVGIETAAAVKTALMGPFAGIGDTIFGMIAGAVFGSIAASMAVEGSAIGIVIWTVWYAAVLFLIRPRLFDMGYTQGIKLVTSLSGQMNALTEAASVLGLTVVGAMIATMVKFPLATINVKIGTDADGSDLMKAFPLMDYANSIMPALFPALLAALCYWLLGQKWMNSNKLIVAVVVLAIVLRVLGVLA
jgi:PTS system mannose-specific IID component